ncbi:hypothetical protein Tco_0526634, partial [Tanacetum coccineum]
KEEPLHVNPTETLDTIRQHAKDKVERQQHVGGNNAEASGSESRQAQQAEPAVGQDGSGIWYCYSSQVPVTETRNADGREMGDGIPTQSSAAGGASEWSFMQFQKLIGNSMVDEERSFKKISSIAEEIMVMIRKRLQKTNVVNDMVWYNDEVRE